MRPTASADTGGALAPIRLRQAGPCAISLLAPEVLSFPPGPQIDTPEVPSLMESKDSCVQWGPVGPWLLVPPGLTPLWAAGENPHVPSMAAHTLHSYNTASDASPRGLLGMILLGTRVQILS